MTEQKNRIVLAGSARAVTPPVGQSRAVDLNEMIEVLLLLRQRPSGGELPAPEESGARWPRARRNLSRAEFAARHGADPADIARVRAFADQYGIEVTQTSVARRSVTLKGTVANLSAAFAVALTGDEQAGGVYLRPAPTRTPSPGATPAPTTAGEITPMFDSAEHLYLGNEVNLQFPICPQFPTGTVQAGDLPLPLLNGLALTFGQILALGGDFFGDIVNGEAQEISDDKNPPTVFNASFKALAEAPSAVNEVSKILAVMQTEIDAVNAAATSGQQPSTAYATLDLNGQYNVATGGGSLASDYYPEGPYLILAARNWDHFGRHASAAYKIGHGVAMQEAADAANQPDSDSQLAGLQLAYALDAFACHFLTDLFAAGHLRTPRHDLYQDGTPSAAGSLDAKYMHDEDNLFGLIVTNPLGDTWKAFGDSRLFDTVDRQNLGMVKNALVFSTREVWQSFDSKTPAGSNYALQCVVSPAQFDNPSDPYNSSPLFYYTTSGGDEQGYCRESLFDLADYHWTDIWSAGSTAGEIAKGPDYSDYVKPLNTITPPDSSISGLQWVTGEGWSSASAVRFAVSFFDLNTGNESELGKWSNWTTIHANDWPTLVGIPLCAHVFAGEKIGRKVYQQFQYSNGSTSTIQLSVTVNDNSTTTAKVTGQ